ncbi:MAG: tRNA-guanosine(34) transglycosylase [Chlamydiae bacterium]|nr:tRNA-guanosine(34) transglycosylase [Chlamydiota bacterium]
MNFELIHQSKKSRARLGKITTPHGVIETPNFVAVGTNGTIKALDNALVSQIGLQLMFCNTYHLLVQPGSATIKKAGGLHQFIHRNLPIITDSGGFQIFSLAYGSVANELKGKGKVKSQDLVVKITEEGALFRSYRDGSKIFLTPENSIEAQKELGADIIIAFDELPPYHIGKKKLTQSLERTHRWEKRSLDTHLKKPQNQALYAVVHGGIDPELREKSCKYLTSLPFDGYAIGGSVGKTKKEMFEILSFTLPFIPRESPNHLLGIGDLESIDLCIPLGIDTFDSSYPTRAARHGIALTSKGPLKVEKAINAHNFNPIDPECICPTCQRYSLGYLHHLFKAKEITALTLTTIHNLQFMCDYMAKIREKIASDLI